MDIKCSFGAGRWLLGVWLAAAVTGCQTEERIFAEQVLRNGKVLTVDSEFSIAEAVAIEAERIVAVGSDTEIAEHIGPDTRVIDLQGRTVIPGLIDNHMHFIRAVQRWNLQARIDGVSSREDALRIMAEKAAAMEPGGMAHGAGRLA